MKREELPIARKGPCWEELWQEEQKERRLLGRAVAAAVFAHGLFFMANPTLVKEVPPPPPPPITVFVVTPVPYLPPHPPTAPVSRPRVVRVPIPDPTPEEFAPLRSPEPQDFPLPELALPADEFPPPPPPPEESDDQPMVVGQVAEPRRRSFVLPQYPEVARRAGKQGTVILQLHLSREGKVKEVKVLRGEPFGLTEAAVAAARQWEYEPAMYQGKPVEVLLTVTIHFSLTHSGGSP